MLRRQRPRQPAAHPVLRRAVRPAAGPGAVVLFTSGQHLAPMSPELPYAISKGAIQQMTLSLADELIDADITVNCVNPGPTDTGWAWPRAGRRGRPGDAPRPVERPGRGGGGRRLADRPGRPVGHRPDDRRGGRLPALALSGSGRRSAGTPASLPAMDILLIAGLWLDASAWDDVVPAARAARPPPACRSPCPGRATGRRRPPSPTRSPRCSPPSTRPSAQPLRGRALRRCTARLAGRRRAARSGRRGGAHRRLPGGRRAALRRLLRAGGRRHGLPRLGPVRGTGLAPTWTRRPGGGSRPPPSRCRSGCSRGVVQLTDPRRFVGAGTVVVCPEFSPAQAQEWIAAGEPRRAAPGGAPGAGRHRLRALADDHRAGRAGPAACAAGGAGRLMAVQRTEQRELRGVPAGRRRGQEVGALLGQPAAHRPQRDRGEPAAPSSSPSVSTHTTGLRSGWPARSSSTWPPSSERRARAARPASPRPAPPGRTRSASGATPRGAAAAGRRRRSAARRSPRPPSTVHRVARLAGGDPGEAPRRPGAEVARPLRDDRQVGAAARAARRAARCAR